MGELVFGAFMPHPPIIVREVGGRELDRVASTVRAMEQACADILAANPEVIAVISPHAPAFQGAVGVCVDRMLKGSFADFGSPEVQFNYTNEERFAEQLIQILEREHFPVHRLSEARIRKYSFGENLDHGVMVPLYYLRQAGFDGSLSVISLGLLPYKDLLRFGVYLVRAIEASCLRVAVVASGDLSHRLLPGAPAGYDPNGKVFDELIQDKLGRKDVEGIVNLPPVLVERAGECGLRPLIMLLGCLSVYEWTPRILSYEGPFGVGYLVCEFFVDKRADAGKAPGREEPVAVRIARSSLESWVKYGQKCALPQDIPPELRDPAGVFVSLKKHGKLRGCIGTIYPTRRTAAEEIAAMAIESGTADPRFPPVEVDELEELSYSVDILKPPQRVGGIEELDPRRYGVIVRSGRKTGLLLPDLPGVDTPEEQVAIAKQKAGIGPGEPFELERFEVIRYC